MAKILRVNVAERDLIGKELCCGEPQIKAVQLYRTS
jgi:hypothetical protein